MCGIAGWIDYDNDVAAGREIIQKMSLTLARRGPDDSGLYLDAGAVLIHRRLAVIDPIGGAQPMTVLDKGEEYTIVYNGELYNTEEVRAQLIALGCNFRGRSDTEVLLKAYIRWGRACLNKLNGIFAFAVYEKNKKLLFAARDRIGVKPLFSLSTTVE